jgi:glutamate/tyrosine decarboxylase-like PLP-dependent enzyme
MKNDDIDWRNGRSGLYMFKATDDVLAVGGDAFMEFFNENTLGARRAFGSVRQMEEDVVAMGLSVFHAPSGGAGFMTTGGSESIVLAVKACRNWVRRKSGRSDHRGNIVVPYSVHPSFSKAAQLMDIDLRRISLADNYRADVMAMARAMDRNTIMLVGSAPCFSYGTFDPIVELAALARERDVWLHVDACIGGYLAPFVKELGYPVPAFDFEIPGVTSISADLHKFAYCPKPASTVFYCDGDRAACQPFETEDWPSGRFMTATIAGTRPAGGVAGAWATMNYLGRKGYLDNARDLMNLVAAYKTGIEAIGLEILGRPDLSILTFVSDEVDMHRVAEVMVARGWLPGLVREPKAMHLLISMLHAPAREDYLRDLGSAVAEVKVGGGKASTIEVAY